MVKRLSAKKTFLRLTTLSAWTIKQIYQSLILCEQNDVWWYFLSWNLGLMQYSLWVLNLNVSVFITCLHISHLVPSHDLQQPSFFSRGATLALARKSLKFLAFKPNYSNLLKNFSCSLLNWAGKWQIHYIIQKWKSWSLPCIFICFLNFKRKIEVIYIYIHICYFLILQNFAAFIFFNIFLWISKVLYNLIFDVYNWLLYIIQLLYIIAQTLGITNIHRIRKPAVFNDLIWEE